MKLFSLINDNRTGGNFKLLFALQINLF